MYRCTSEVTHGEKVLAGVLSGLGSGLVLLNPVIPARRGEQEVDAVVITAAGVITFEQKDVSHGGGRLTVPANATPNLDGTPIDALEGARRQARLHAQCLASLMKENDPPTDVGFIHSVLAVHGVDEVRGAAGHVQLTTTGAALSVVQEHFDGRPVILSTPIASALLERLGVGAVPLPDLLAQGFPPTTTIEPTSNRSGLS